MNLEGSSVVEVLWSFVTGGENVGESQWCEEVTEVRFW